MAAFEFTFLAKDPEEVQKVEVLLTQFEGKKLQEVAWGKRDLAYPINKIMTADYVTWQIDIAPSQVILFRQKLNFEKTPLRYIILKKDEK